MSLTDEKLAAENLPYALCLQKEQIFTVKKRKWPGGHGASENRQAYTLKIKRRERYVGNASSCCKHACSSLHPSFQNLPKHLSYVSTLKAISSWDKNRGNRFSTSLWAVVKMCVWVLLMLRPKKSGVSSSPWDETHSTAAGHHSCGHLSEAGGFYRLPRELQELWSNPRHKRKHFHNIWQTFPTLYVHFLCFGLLCNFGWWFQNGDCWIWEQSFWNQRKKMLRNARRSMSLML